MLISLGRVCGDTYMVVSELSSGDRDFLAYKTGNIYYLTFYKKSLLTLTLKIKV